MGLNNFKSFTLGFVSCVLLVACAGATFPYRHYPYDIKNHMLVGDKPENDLKDDVCWPNSNSKQPCTVMLTDAFFKMKGNYLKCQNDLAACQRGSVLSQ